MRGCCGERGWGGEGGDGKEGGGYAAEVMKGRSLFWSDDE